MIETRVVRVGVALVSAMALLAVATTADRRRLRFGRPVHGGSHPRRSAAPWR